MSGEADPGAPARFDAGAALFEDLTLAFDAFFG
jgi:hypothetical protein